MKRSINIRHNKIVDMVYDISKIKSITAIKEKKPISDVDVHARPDLIFYQAPTNHTHHIDVSIIHPGASTYCKNASKYKLAAASLREKMKLNHYQKEEYYKRNSKYIKIIPFVMESTGAFGESVDVFLSKI